MKKLEKNKFYKTNSKGISLIVLIITIIVIVILATAILVSVINNNPISEANKARYESDRDNMQAVFTNTVGKIMAENQGTVNVTAGQINTETTGVNETTGEVEYTVNNATISANASGKIVFDKGTNGATTYYIGKKLPIYQAGETKWYVDSEGVLSLEVAGVKYGTGEVEETGQSAEPSAAAVALDPAAYYGKTVTNYETGDATIDAQVDWQIFHSDGNNIYLIATDYIAGSLAPASKAGNGFGYTGYIVAFDSVYSDYAGSADITDTTLVGLNSKYHAYLTANNTTSGTNGNMQAVSYMLDTSETVWGKFAGENAAYAIGGPTIELFLSSYNNKYDTDYQCQVTSATGYQLSDNGTIWDDQLTGLNTSDTQYVISSRDKAEGIYLASPTSSDTWSLVDVNDSGYVYYSELDNGLGDNDGLRPIICLNSNVALEAVEGGFAIVK